MKGHQDGGQRKRLIGILCFMLVLLGLAYYGSSSGRGASAVVYGKSLRKLGSSYLGGDDDSELGDKQDDSMFALDDGDYEFKPRSYPVCDKRHSELIPCLDRNLIYQLRLKLDLSVMEHYERHCPPTERRFNCLIPPPPGYKVPIKWPKSRDEVWKANIPHTHLAHEKSDQNWMVDKGDKIVFPGGGTHFHYGADRYIASLANRDGILLLELDRLLRPGGYFAYSSPEAYAQDEEDLRIWHEMSALVERMCWKVAEKRNQTVIWVKPSTNDCYHQREPGTQPPMCRSTDDPDAVWNVPMEACITPYSEQNHRDRGSGLTPWPARLTAPPPRLADFGYSSDVFEEDTETWQRRVDVYWNLLNRKIKPNSLRNLMDMKANLGSFAAALKNKDVWVMNVVPEDGPNTLKIVYDRGLIGATHNWCESFSTYPRTYDLLHAWTVFSDVEKKGCSGEDLLFEIDRILRPSGYLIIRDKKFVIEFVTKYLTALHWESVALVDSDEEDKKVFLIQKKMWLASPE